MNVLVACEYSARVRDAFRALGHEAWSCDLLPTDGDDRYHVQGDALKLLGHGWDLLIAHPPCTYLTVAGMHWNKNPNHWRGQTLPGDTMTRGERESRAGLEFVKAFMDAPVKRICVENPVSIISSHIRKPEQIIQPWMFGHRESKKTCLWLKGLPTLKPTKIETLAPGEVWDNQTPSGQNKLGPSDDRWKIRSTTYQGIANAMAAQWGSLT